MTAKSNDSHHFEKTRKRASCRHYNVRRLVLTMLLKKGKSHARSIYTYGPGLLMIGGAIVCGLQGL